MKICRYPDIPVGEVKYIPNMDVLIHNIKNSELEEKDKEIERLKQELEFERQIKKEAREYIKSYSVFYEDDVSYFVKAVPSELLNILDKENK